MDNFGDNTPMLNELLKEYREGRLNESSSVPLDKAAEAGITVGEEPQIQTEPEGNQVDVQGIAHNEMGEKQHQKLGFWASQGDMLKTVGSEALRVFAPRVGGKAADVLGYSEADLWQHQSQTRYAESLKYLYRYTADTLAIAGLAAVTGGATVAFGAAKNAPKLIKAGKFLQTLSKGGNLAKTTKGGWKAKGVDTLNKVAALGIGDIGSSFLMWEEGEGHLADMLPQNKYLSFLQTRSDDTEFQGRLKNVVENTLVGMGINAMFRMVAKPSVESYYKAAQQAVQAKSEKELANAMNNMAKAQSDMERVFSLNDRVEAVKAFKKQADETGEELSQLIIDNVPAKHQEEMLEMGKVLSNGEEIFQHSDGTWDIAVNNWEEAYKVSAEEYQKQMLAQDVKNGLREGDTAINHQDKAVQSTWVNRGWIGANEKLNVKNANKIVKNYKDKFEIDNNIKVEFVDGLTVKGNTVEGNTQSTKFLGKISKTKQNAIDKKTLQVQKLEAKITMLEGGNTPVTEELEVIKEELRIARNELTELQKTVDKKNLKPDITIQIDKKTANPYAVLRSELEHARDIAKGEVPKKADIEGSGEHFSRYVGDNEAEVAAGYTHKKSTGRAKALGEKAIREGQVQEIGKMSKNTAQALSEGYVFKEEAAETFSGEGFRVDIYAPDGKSLGYVEYCLEGDTLHLDQAMNSSHGTSYYEKGVAAKLIDYILSKYPDVKYIGMDATTPEGRVLKNKFIKEHPYLKGKVKGVSTKEELDEIMNNDYNSRGENVDNAPNNQMQKPTGNDSKVSGDSSSSDIGLNGEKVSATNATAEQSTLENDVVGGGTRTNVERGNSSTGTGTGHQQLSIFEQEVTQAASTEDVVKAIAKGDTLTVEEATAALNKVIETDVEISGHTWEDICNDADGIYERFFKDKLSELYRAMLEGDAAACEYGIRKALAGEKVLAKLQEELKNVEKGSREWRNIMRQMESIVKSLDTLKSGAGRALNAYKLINKAAEAMRGSSTSELTQAGISRFVDILEEQIGLAFTRGNVATTIDEFRIYVYNQLFSIPEADRFFQGNGEFTEIVNKYIDKAFDSEMRLDTQHLIQDLIDMITKEQVEEKGLLVSLCRGGDRIWETLKNWTPKAAGFSIGNMLGLKTLSIGVESGLAMLAASANKRILGGMLTGNTSLMTQGKRQLEGFILNWKECWDLAYQAFQRGDGQLTTTKQMVDGSLENGLKEWDWSAGNLLTGVCRLMMASDELMTQLNYRSIMRAKCLEEAEQMFKGRKYTEEEFQKVYQNLFDSKAFNKDDRPLDVKAFAEAKETLFQTPLNRKMMDYSTGNNTKIGDLVDIGPESYITRAGASVENLVYQHPIMRHFMPFIRTPFNIADKVYQSTNPFVLANRFTSKDPLIRAQAAHDTAMLLLTVMATGIGVMTGTLTGTPPINGDERRALMKTGWQPYSIKIGNKFISYKGMAPFDGILAMCVDGWSVLDRARSKDEEDDYGVARACGEFLGYYVNDVLEQTGFRGNLVNLVDIFDFTKSDTERERLMSDFLSKYIPLNSVARDVSTFGTHEELKPLDFWQRLLKSYAPKNMDYKRDCFGNRSCIANYWVTKVKDTDFDTPEYQEMVDLAKHGWSPSEMSKQIGDYELPFTEYRHKETKRSAYDYMMEEASTLKIGDITLREAVRSEVTSEEYNALPYNDKDPEIDTKRKRIQAIFQLYYEEAKLNILKRGAEEFVDKKGIPMHDRYTEIEQENKAKALSEITNMY